MHQVMHLQMKGVERGVGIGTKRIKVVGKGVWGKATGKSTNSRESRIERALNEAFFGFCTFSTYFQLIGSAVVMAALHPVGTAIQAWLPAETFVIFSDLAVGTSHQEIC